MTCEFYGQCNLRDECEARGDFSQPPCASKFELTNNIEKAINIMDAFVRNHNTLLEVEAWQTLKNKYFNRK